MDKSIVLAVAGAGKTSSIVSRLDLTKRVLILTYADNNVETIRAKVARQFGHIPPNIAVYSYFTFLHSFCYRPFLLLQMGRTKGLTFKSPPLITMRFNRASDSYYVDSNKRLYHGRLSKLLFTKNVVADVVARIEKYFDALYIDEVQDFGGHDFDFLKAIIAADTEVLLVGDFFQSTYTTSRDGSTNKNLHKDFANYLAHFRDSKIKVDQESLLKSHRCSPSVCEFIRNNMGIDIHSHSTVPTVVKLVDTQDEAERLYGCHHTVKLFYEEHFRYDCYSQNWGASKGQDHYNDVCVVLNETAYTAYKSGDLRNLKPLTKNKFYVACSRARGNLFFVPGKLFNKFKTVCA